MEVTRSRRVAVYGKSEKYSRKFMAHDEVCIHVCVDMIVWGSSSVGRVRCSGSLFSCVSSCSVFFAY